MRSLQITIDNRKGGSLENGVDKINIEIELFFSVGPSYLLPGKTVKLNELIIVQELIQDALIVKTLITLEEHVFTEVLYSYIEINNSPPEVSTGLSIIWSALPLRNRVFEKVSYGLQP